MPQSVEAFALLLLQHEQRASANLREPVLVWSVSRSATNEGEGNAPFFGTMTSNMTTRRPRAGEAIFFHLRKEPGSANPFAMGITLGRTDTNDIPVVDGSVSRFHAYFQQDPRTAAWRVVDADSKNGTWLGPLKLTPSTPYPLTDGARLRFGDIEMTFWQPASFIAHVKERLGGADG